MENFLKYYWLEQEYLEKEVRRDFHERKPKHLTVEEFFAIVEWKNPKFGKTKLSYLTDKDIRKFTEDIGKETDKKKQLEILLMDGAKDRKGIRLATASAVLTILYPDDFTVYDIRVRKQLAKGGVWEKVEKLRKDGIKEYIPEDITGSKNQIQRYFTDYVPNVLMLGRKLSTRKLLSLRDCDRFLWVRDWYEELRIFLKNRK